MIQRISKRDLVAQTLHKSGCGRLFQIAGSWRGLLVLNYHRIGNGFNSSFDRNLWSASAEDFEYQVRTVSRDFDVIGLDDMEHVVSRRGGKYVLITFDDGYYDNYTDAFPILKSYSAKAVFFLATGFLDSPKVPWWDEIAWMVRHSPIKTLPASRWIDKPIALEESNHELAIRTLLKVYKKLSGEETANYLNYLSEATQSPRCPEHIAHQLWMNWAMVREMKQAGMAFGGHTVNHPILGNLPADQQEFEIAECQRRLTAELGVPATAFSYPVGGPGSFNQHTFDSLERNGFRWGFTYFGGNLRTPTTNRYALPRAAIETDVNQTMFQAILTLPQWFG